MPIYQMHKDHGRHIAESPQEAEANRKNGWKDVTKQEFHADISKDDEQGDSKPTLTLKKSEKGIADRA